MKRIIELNLILGVWLILSPFVLAYATGHVPAMSNDIGVGVVLVVCSAWIMTVGATAPLGAVAIEALCGLWLIAAPFALRERALTHALANNVIVGAIVLVVSLGEAWMLTGRPHRTA